MRSDIMLCCDECCKENDWLVGVDKEFGECEMCGEQGMCNEIPDDDEDGLLPDSYSEENAAKQTVDIRKALLWVMKKHKLTLYQLNFLVASQMLQIASDLVDLDPI